MLTIDLPVWPPEAEALLNDPRLAQLRHQPGAPTSRQQLEPATRAQRGESAFVLFDYEIPEDDEGAEVLWTNQPNASLAWGNGSGFPACTEMPHFTEARAKPALYHDAWKFGSWLIVSPRFADTLRRYDPDAIETLAIDWRFADGQALDGYAFLDVRRLVYAYDYQRSQVVVAAGQQGRRVWGFGQHRALKRDLEPGLHIFRDAAHRSSIFISRELARALMAQQLQYVDFLDPADLYSIRAAG